MACLSGWSRLRVPSLHAALTRATASLAGAGWSPLWCKIPRSENSEADRQARLAATLATNQLLDAERHDAPPSPSPCPHP